MPYRSINPPVTQAAGNFTVGGQVLAAAGSASAPSYAFTAETNTGWWRVSSGRVGLTIAGSRTWEALNGYLVMKSNTNVTWTSGDADQGSDTGLARVSAGFVEVNDGNAGTLRDLRLRSLFQGGSAGGATTVHQGVHKKTGIADNTATDILTVTVPNGEHAAAIELWLLASLGTGDDTFESSRVALGAVVLARKTGVNVVPAVAALTNAQIATTAGGGTLTLAYGVSAVSGAVGATNTFTVQVTLVKTGTITDLQCVVAYRLINAQASGVSIATA